MTGGGSLGLTTRRTADAEWGEPPWSSWVSVSDGDDIAASDTRRAQAPSVGFGKVCDGLGSTPRLTQLNEHAYISTVSSRGWFWAVALALCVLFWAAVAAIAWSALT